MVLAASDPDPDAPSYADTEDLRGLGFPKTPRASLCEPWMWNNHRFQHRMELNTSLVRWRALVVSEAALSLLRRRVDVELDYVCWFRMQKMSSCVMGMLILIDRVVICSFLRPEHRGNALSFLFLCVEIRLSRWPNEEMESGEYRGMKERLEMD